MEIFIATVCLGCAWMLLARPRRPKRPVMAYLPPDDGPYRPDYGEREYESELNPQVKLYRHEWEEEQRKLKVIDGLLDTLTPADAEADLFTAWERAWFNLKAHKKRPAE